jgi:hypothetical protein
VTNFGPLLAIFLSPSYRPDHPAPMDLDKIDEILAFHTAQKEAIYARLANLD